MQAARVGGWKAAIYVVCFTLTAWNPLIWDAFELCSEQKSMKSWFQKSPLPQWDGLAPAPSERAPGGRGAVCGWRNPRGQTVTGPCRTLPGAGRGRCRALRERGNEGIEPANRFQSSAKSLFLTTQPSHNCFTCLESTLFKGISGYVLKFLIFFK